MTAIAAVIALSSTPLFAQVADEPITSTPVIDTTPTPVVADPLAAEPVAETPAAAEPAAAAPAAKPAARKATAKTTAAKPTTARSRPAPARAASAAPAAAPAPAVVTMAPIAAAPVEPLPTQLEVPPVEAPVAPPPATAEAFAMDETTMLAAGAGGLALLTLAGAGLAVRRRRRRRLEAEDAQWQYEAEHTDAALAPAETAEPQRAPTDPQPGYMPEQTEPAFVRAFADAPAAAPVAAPVAAAPVIAEATLGEPADPIEGPTTDLPEGFDLSRFGPHVQAAYKGPTEDNPSLSLKYRLRRAAALDQMARKQAAEQPGAARPAESSVPRPAADQANGEFLLRRAATKPSMKPAYSE